jgi:hypothetical protein
LGVSGRNNKLLFEVQGVFALTQVKAEASPPGGEATLFCKNALLLGLFFGEHFGATRGDKVAHVKGVEASKFVAVCVEAVGRENGVEGDIVMSGLGGGGGVGVNG